MNILKLIELFTKKVGFFLGWGVVGGGAKEAKYPEHDDAC